MFLGAFAKSDPMGDVFSFLCKRAQGNLRSSARMFRKAFDAAVRAEIQIDRCGNKEIIETREDFGALKSWFPISEKHCKEAPASSTGQLGTLVVNLHILFSGAPHIPDDFLYGCIAQSVIYFQAEHITSAGDRWMWNCSRLNSVSFEGFTALTTVGDGWLYGCTDLTGSSLGFEGLNALTTVGNRWLQYSMRLTSISFEGLTALTTVGESWLQYCMRLTSVSFKGLKALNAVGGGWLYRSTSLTTVSSEGLSLELIRRLPQSIPKEE